MSCCAASVTEDLPLPPSAYCVPTTTLRAEVRFADGSCQRGLLYLPPAAARHAGPMRPEERLNDSDDFLPFLPEGCTEPVMLNKHQVMVLSLDAAEDEKLREPWEAVGGVTPLPAAPEQRVVLECTGLRLEGVLVMDVPQHQQRLLDLLNRQERFVRLRSDGKLHLVSRERIVRASDVSER